MTAVSDTELIGGTAGGRAGLTPSPMGPSSFIFTYIFTEKCLRQRSLPPLMGACPPYGKSWIRHWNLFAAP